MKVFWSHLELDLQLLELPVGLEIIMYRYKHMCIYCIIQLYTSVHVSVYVDTYMIQLPTFRIF